MNLEKYEIRWLFDSLRRISFFSTATIENIDKIIEAFSKRKYDKGELIIEEGKPGAALYIIKSGSCLVYRKRGLFKKDKIAVLCKDDFFGEMSLLWDKSTSASVKTLEPSDIFFYLKSDFLKLIFENKELRRHLLAIAKEREFINEGKPDYALAIRQLLENNN